MSVRAYEMSFILNELVINKRKSAIEFGAGISTILMARLFKMNGIDVQLVSVDENEKWIDLIKGILTNEGLASYVKFIQSPLESCSVNGKNIHWYNKEILNNQIDNSKKFDLVIVDGPTAYKKEISLSRYEALPFLLNNLAEEHVIFLDDANRDGEKKVLSLWQNKYNKSFKIYGSTLAVHHTGFHFEANPMKHIN
jgi:predicted O-methyltransferase YrrM